MKRKTNLLKFSLVALFLLISSAAWSATYYVCAGSTLSLNPGSPVTGITYMWDVKQTASGPSIQDYPRAGAPTTLPGPGTYIVYLISSQTTPSSTICPPDVVENTFIVLPPITLVLDNPTNATYCGAHSITASSVVAVAPTLTLPSNTGSDLVYEYSYSVSIVKGGNTTVVDGATIGTINQTTGAYTLTATDPGTYTITGSVKYKQAPTFTGTLLGTTGCPATSTTTKVVEVLAAPTAPVITISAN